MQNLQQYSHNSLTQNYNYESVSNQSQNQYSGSNRGGNLRTGDFHRNYSRGHHQKLSDVDHLPVHHQKNYSQRQRYSNESQWSQNQLQTRHQRSRQESYSSRKNTDSGESTSHREYHNKNYNRSYENKQSNKLKSQPDAASKFFYFLPKSIKICC